MEQHKFQYDIDFSLSLLSLSQQVKWNRKANGFRLPTEVEWEYAAKTAEPSWLRENIDVYAWHKDNIPIDQRKDQYPFVIGQKHPNPWGLYDMIGHVQEWLWGRDEGSVQEGTMYRPLRGGDRRHPPSNLSCTRRAHAFATYNLPLMGFRLARNIEHTTD